MSGKGKGTGEEAKRGLPSSGLAEEILGALPGVKAAPSGPDALYAFADSLQEEHQRTAEKTHEQALETWVTFTLDREVFGLPVSHVQEILRVATITRVPHAPLAVRGVTNMRGRVLPVVDLRVRLGLSGGELGDHSRILVVNSRGRLMGLLVDSVQQVLRLDRNHFQPPPPDVMTTQSEYILGVYHLQESLVILLDVDRALVVAGALSARAAG